MKIFRQGLKSSQLLKPVQLQAQTQFFNSTEAVTEAAPEEKEMDLATKNQMMGVDMEFNE
jgi:hypothetical protein